MFVVIFFRDSYSGDVFYEFFYDLREGFIGSSFDDELCVFESLLGLVLGVLLFMCSFYVGAEENLVLALGLDLFS